MFYSSRTVSFLFQCSVFLGPAVFALAVGGEHGAYRSLEEAKGSISAVSELCFKHELPRSWACSYSSTYCVAQGMLRLLYDELECTMRRKISWCIQEAKT